jgi:hypothetical protein
VSGSGWLQQQLLLLLMMMQRRPPGLAGLHGPRRAGPGRPRAPQVQQRLRELRSEGRRRRGLLEAWQRRWST